MPIPPPSTPAAGSVTCRIGARGVSRSFGSVRANIDVSLTVRQASVHAIVGENGAGKSTLMRMLYGLDIPDTGAIVVDDDEVTFSGPRDAIARGIGLVQQELAIIPELTLLENLVLGAEPRAGLVWNRKQALLSATDLATTVGVEIDWNLSAAHASIALQQQVEILRLLYRGADVLILDEPTAVLAPAQAAELLRLLLSLRDAGRTVIFISHKLDEVIEIADDITILRSGRTVSSFRRGEIDRAGLTELIIGDRAPDERDDADRPAIGEAVLIVDGLSASDDRGIPRLSEVGFRLHRGEIVGVAAVAGNGQEELAEALLGVRAASAGSIRLDGTEIRRATVRERRRLGVRYVSADRKREGLGVDLSLVDNAIASSGLSQLGRAGWLSRAAVGARTRAVLERAAVRFGTAKDPASSLSGGNQQRVVIGRETIDEPRVLIASQPTRGVDVRGIGYIHELLRQARDDGAAILLFSEELDELHALADRIVVLCQGRVAGTLPGDAPRTRVGSLMLGESATTTKEEGR